MNTITTEAWLLKRGEGRKPEPGTLEKGFFTFPDISAEEVLAEPIVGCWEGNMAHAIQRQPIDICQQRNEDQVVLGNAGVVRILKSGEAVTTVKEGALCIVFCNGVWDKYGYPIKILAVDAPNTMGVLAKQMKLHQKQVIAIPEGSSYSRAMGHFLLALCDGLGELERHL